MPEPDVTEYVRWFGKTYVRIPGVTYHGSGEATAKKFLSRKDGLVHQQDWLLERSGLAYGVCGQRYNIYPKAGFRGVKGIPTTALVTCMQCILLEDP